MIRFMNVKHGLGLLAVAILLGGCKQEQEKKESGDKKEPGEATSGKAAEAPSRVKHGTNGEVIVTIEAKLQPAIGLEFAPLQAAQLTPELKAYGRTVDPSPLASVVAD